MNRHLERDLFGERNEKKDRIREVYARARSPEGLSMSHTEWVKSYAKRWGYAFKETGLGVYCSGLRTDMLFLRHKGYISTSDVGDDSSWYRRIFQASDFDFITLPVSKSFWKRKKSRKGSRRHNDTPVLLHPIITYS